MIKTPKNLAFDVNMMVFVTNDLPDRQINFEEFLGISPCPEGLNKNGYSLQSNYLNITKQMTL